MVVQGAVIVVLEGNGVYCASTVTTTTPSWLLLGVGEQVRWVSLMMVADTEVGVGRVANMQDNATDVDVALIVVAWKRRKEMNSSDL